MNQQQFQAKYQDACIKAALGVYIIRTAGDMNNIPQETLESNVRTLVNALADGIQLDRTDVMNDVMLTLGALPPSYLRHRKMIKLMEDITQHLVQRGLMPALGAR